MLKKESLKKEDETYKEELYSSIPHILAFSKNNS